ncbi:MAG TPA: hypothetical protein VNN72_12945, partial [Polyangiaceae bacterium]|nr:hypothetical protein [Polyangiaceae bacterium]
GDDASWRQAHEALVRLATERAGLDFEEGRALLRARRSGAHVRLGFASFLEYTERLFGYGPKLTQEKLRVAEALEELPQIAGELRTGVINFSVAREVTRVAIPATEKEWLEAARGRTVREVEQLVNGHRPGGLPDDVPDFRLERHVLRLELSGEVFATYREAMAKIRRDAGEPLDDDAAFLLLCRQTLAGNRDPGRSSYQIALTVCERCRQATQQGRGELIEVGPEIVEMAECDAQHIGHVDAHVGVRDDADARVHVGADSADARDYVGAGCDGNTRAHVGSGPARAAQARATQTIPPAKRRTVLRRDAKCRVPGCRHAVFTEPHHLERRCEGGKHLVANLLTLCGAHHRAAHDGSLIITGTPSSGLSFAHADGTPYGGTVRPAAADVRAKAFQALAGMGFRESEAKRALARIPHSVSSLEQVILQALRELAPQ